MDEDGWWSAFVERVVAEAKRRGGAAYVQEDLVQLAPPEAGGESIRLFRYDDGICKARTGFVAATLARFIEFDGPDGMLRIVVAIMDGAASEFADIGADGQWINARTYIPVSNGSVGMLDPVDRPGREPVRWSFPRRIPAWTSRGQEGGEEEEEEGLAGGDG